MLLRGAATTCGVGEKIEYRLPNDCRLEGDRQPGQFLEQSRRNRVHGEKQPIDIINMMAAPIPPHAVAVRRMKFFRRQGIHPDLIQLDGGDKTSEKNLEYLLALAFWSWALIQVAEHMSSLA